MTEKNNIYIELPIIAVAGAGLIVQALAITIKQEAAVRKQLKIINNLEQEATSAGYDLTPEQKPIIDVTDLSTQRLLDGDFSSEASLPFQSFSVGLRRLELRKEQTLNLRKRSRELLAETCLGVKDCISEIIEDNIK